MWRTLCGLVEGTSVLEEPVASTIRVEDVIEVEENSMW
jgi:hypothetical protein